MEEKNNSLSIPMAIVGAGIIIAIGIYLSNYKGTNPTIGVEAIKTESIDIKPVSNADHILGNPDAPITVVEFSDLECPFCKQFETTMNSLMDTYGKDGKLAWVYRHFPVHPKRAEKEAEASECVNELGGNNAFWKFTEGIFATTSSDDNLDPAKLPIIAKNAGVDVSAFNTCLSSGKYYSLILSDSNDAKNAGAQGTPYSVIILKNQLSTDTVKSLQDFISTNQLQSNVIISGDKKEIVLNGALPLSPVQGIIDLILK